MDNRFFQEPNTKEDIPVLKHKRLDLRHQEDFRKFFAKKFVFQVNAPKPISIGVHSTLLTKKLRPYTALLKTL